MVISNYLFRTRYLSPFSSLEIKNVVYEGNDGRDVEKIVIFSGEYNKIMIMDSEFVKVEKSKYIETGIFETFEQHDVYQKLKKGKKLDPDDLTQFPNLLEIGDKFRILIYQECKQDGKVRVIFMPVDYWVRRGEIWEFDE